MKHKFILALLVITVLAIGGCGKKDTASDAATTENTETSDQADAAATTDGSTDTTVDTAEAATDGSTDTTVDTAEAATDGSTEAAADTAGTVTDAGAEAAATADAATGTDAASSEATSADDGVYVPDATITRDNITKYLSDASDKTLLETGMEYLKNGESEKAFEILTVAAGESTDDEELEQIYRGLGICLMGRDKYEDAIRAFNTALSYAAADAKALEYDICYYKASALVRLDRLNDALDLYNLLIDYKPEGKTYIGRGAVYAKLGNTELAQADFDQGIKEDPKNYDLYIEIYELLNAAGRDDLGQTYLQKALEIEKDSSKNNLEKGKIYYYMGDYDQAKTELEKLKSEDEPDVLLYLARTYEALGDPNYAATLYEQYLEYDSSDGSIYNMLGLLDISQGNYQDALDIIQKGIDNAITGKQNLYHNEIVAYEYLRDYTTAKEKLTEYIANYPEDSDAQREMIFLNSRTRG